MQECAGSRLRLGEMAAAGTMGDFRVCFAITARTASIVRVAGGLGRMTKCFGCVSIGGFWYLSFGLWAYLFCWFQGVPRFE